eukprot:GHRQ01013596.1.p1 GENE.GHRQ01013596.1~~GHRQ01013596.1.p1  ORF type:complete len:183 (+),score=76.59 GHRQ01013596.1:521-1069(+)
MLTHEYTDPVAVDITFEMGGTDAQRLLVASIRKCSSSDSEHLMVTDHKGRIIYLTSKLAELLGSSPKGLLRTDFSRLMAQPFSQLHSKWMKARAAAAIRLLLRDRRSCWEELGGAICVQPCMPQAQCSEAALHLRGGTALKACIRGGVTLTRANVAVSMETTSKLSMCYGRVFAAAAAAAAV